MPRLSVRAIETWLVVLVATAACRNQSANFYGEPVSSTAEEVTYEPRCHESDGRKLCYHVTSIGGAFLQGDIAFDEKAFTEGLQLGLGYKDVYAARLWTGGIVPYELGKSLNADQREDFLHAIREIKFYTGIQFIPRRPTDNDYIEVINSPYSYSYSYLGRLGGRQEYALIRNAGFSTAIHEIGHALGLQHEQNRSDRDEHVKVHFNNIKPAFHYAFEKDEARLRDIGPYDFSSVMHYGEYDFSKNGKKTITAKRKIASHGLSQGDIGAIRELYRNEVTAPPAPSIKDRLVNIYRHKLSWSRYGLPLDYYYSRSKKSYVDANTVYGRDGGVHFQVFAKAPSESVFPLCNPQRLQLCRLSTGSHFLSIKGCNGSTPVETLGFTCKHRGSSREKLTQMVASVPYYNPNLTYQYVYAVNPPFYGWSKPQKLGFAPLPY